MTETAVSAEQQLAEMLNTEDEVKNNKAEQEEKKSDRYQFTKKNRANTIRFTTGKNKIPCWMSFDIHLVDIILAHEQFVINGWLLIFFKDDNKDFEHLFDEKKLKQICENKYIKYEDLDVAIRKKLPLKQTFLLNASDIDIKKTYLELKNADEHIWKLYFRFNASCAEHMELTKFPFDAQFLNLQIVYRIDDFYFLSEQPEWIESDDQFKIHMPIKLTVKDSIKSQWKVEEPWVDFRKNRGKKYNFHFSVIRLRVRRRPIFHLVNGVLPLFLVIACSFASFVMPIDEYLGDKLAYIITLLLTTAALQYALGSDLPKTSETTMIDAYILYGYGILSFFTLEIAVVYKIYDLGYDDMARIVDYVTVGIMGLIWLFKSLQFVYQYHEFKNNDVDWNQVSDEEMQGWSKDMHCDKNDKNNTKTKYMGVADGQFKGTDDQ